MAVLRNPTERAISHYFHECRMGREKLAIMDTMLTEEARLRPFIESKDYKHSFYIHHSYKKRGRYLEQLSRYLEHFPPEQLLVFKSEELFSATGNTVRRVFEFIGVDEDFKIADLKAWNISANRTNVDRGEYDYLKNYFRPYNQALYQLIGQDFGWDSETPESKKNRKHAKLIIMEINYNLAVNIRRISTYIIVLM